MRLLEIDRDKIEIFDDIENLPIKRFHKFNKMMLIDSNVGGDLTDIEKHIYKTKIFIKKNEKENAFKELDNLRQNLYFLQNEISPKNLSFAVLVKSVNGKECEDISEEGLKNTLKLIENIDQKKIIQEIEKIKKK